MPKIEIKWTKYSSKNVVNEAKNPKSRKNKTTAAEYIILNLLCIKNIRIKKPTIFETPIQKRPNKINIFQSLRKKNAATAEIILCNIVSIFKMLSFFIWDLILINSCVVKTTFKRWKLSKYIRNNSEKQCLNINWFLKFVLF